MTDQHRRKGTMVRILRGLYLAAVAELGLVSAERLWVSSFQECLYFAFPSEPPADPDRAKWHIGDANAAIERARGYLGLEAVGWKGADAELVVGKDDSTPYLSQKIDQQNLWRVTFTDLDLLQASDEELAVTATPRPDRVVDVYVGPERGDLRKIVSRWPVGEPSMSPEPSIQSATLQLSYDAMEVWYDFSAEPPKVSLAQALRIIQSNGGDVRGAKQIVAYCVQWTIMERQPPKRVWSVTLRGIPPFEAAFPGVPEAARNHLRHIVDAETGEWIKATTSPQPDQPAPKQGDETRKPKPAQSSGGG